MAQDRTELLRRFNLLIGIDSYTNNNSNFNLIKNFISNPNNEVSINSAIAKYGMPDELILKKYGFVTFYTANGQKVDSIWNYFSNNFIKLYQAARIYEKYPVINLKSTSNCSKIKTLKLALDEEKVYIDNQFVADQDAGKYQQGLAVINDYLSDLNGAYSSMNCDKVIYDKQKEEDLSNISNAVNVGTTESKTSSIGTYIMYGIVVLIVGIVVRKLVIKKN